MTRLNDGRWTKELSLAPGRYEYRFVADGQWLDDPAATIFALNGVAVKPVLGAQELKSKFQN